MRQFVLGSSSLGATTGWSGDGAGSTCVGCVELVAWSVASKSSVVPSLRGERERYSSIGATAFRKRSIDSGSSSSTLAAKTRQYLATAF